MDYFGKIQESIKFTWKYKILWLFGLIIGFFGNGYNSNFNSSFNSNGNDDKYSEAGDKFEELVENGLFLVILAAVVCIGLIIALIGWYLTSVSKGALINAVQIEAKGEEPTFKKGWIYGKTKAWTFIKMDLVVMGIAIVLSIILVPIFVVSVIFPPFLCLLCLLIPVGIIAGIAWTLLYTAAQRYIVLKNYGAIDSLKAGWKLLRNQFADYFIAALVSIIPSCAWALVLLPVGILAAIAAIIAIIAVVAISPVVGLVLIIILVLAFGLLTGALNSPYVVYSYTYWTKVIMELMEREGSQK